MGCGTAQEVVDRGVDPEGSAVGGGVDVTEVRPSSAFDIHRLLADTDEAVISIMFAQHIERIDILFECSVDRDELASGGGDEMGDEIDLGLDAVDFGDLFGDLGGVAVFEGVVGENIVVDGDEVGRFAQLFARTAHARFGIDEDGGISVDIGDQRQEP